MKYCEHCGFSNENTAKYCEECGAPLAEAEEQAAPAYDAETAESTAEPQNRETASEPQSRETAVSVVRRMLSSPILLAIAVLFTLSVVFTVIKSIDPSYNLSLTAFTISTLEGFDIDLSALENNEVFKDIMSFMQTKSIGLAISSSLPSILLCVALFMQYSAARSAKGGSVSTAGLTVIRVMAVLSLIGAILVSVLTVGLFGFLIVAMSQTEIPAFIVLLAVILIFVTAGFGLWIAFYVGALRTLGVIRKAAKNNIANSHISSYVAVILIIVGALSALGAFYSLGIQSVSGIAGGAANILLGVFLFRYRDAMQPIEARKPM